MHPVAFFALALLGVAVGFCLGLIWVMWPGEPPERRAYQVPPEEARP